MKLNFNVFERSIILASLPKEGNILSLRMTRELVSKLGFSAKDYDEFEIKQKDDRTYWNQKGFLPVEFEIADPELVLIKEGLDSFVMRLDELKKLTMEILNLHEKIDAEYKKFEGVRHD